MKNLIGNSWKPASNGEFIKVLNPYNYMILDIGHYESEIDFVENIISILKKKISKFAIYNTTKNNNPIYYI
mgnify:CR=1 FL=1